jgi:membrane-bound lytic murein transglycosylase D
MPKSIMRPFFPAFTILVVLIIGCIPPEIPVAESLNDETAEARQGTIAIRDDEISPAIPGAAEEDNAADLREADLPGVEEGRDSASTSGEAAEGEQSFLDGALDLAEASRESWLGGDVEKALEALDHAYALIVQVDPGGDSKLIQQKEDLRFTISKRILEIYASRYRTVNGSHKAIPLTMNKYVEREIKRFKNEERRFFIESYRRSGGYRGEIVKALKEAGLPEELSWLPLIESGFKVKALSPARALGLWQFIPSTGYKFGLMRNTWIDERMDPVKSTAAAIAYLKELHSIFGDWATVLAAYNCGEGTVLRAIRRQKIDYLDDFWDLYERLPGETARYYPRFLAVLTILKDPARYGITLEEPDAPRQCEVVTVEKPLHLKTAAKRMRIPFEELAELNPELRRHATPGSPYPLKVPPGKSETLLAGLDALPEWSPPKRAYVLHRVTRGETLSLLALRYRTSIRAIVELNNIRRNHFIRVGQKLKIPLKGTA